MSEMFLPKQSLRFEGSAQYLSFAVLLSFIELLNSIETQ